MEIVKVYENFYEFYKVVNEKNNYSTTLLIFDSGNLVAHLDVCKETRNIFNFFTTDSFTYSNLSILQKDLEEALKIAI